MGSRDDRREILIIAGKHNGTHRKTCIWDGKLGWEDTKGKCAYRRRMQIFTISENIQVEAEEI